MPLDLIAEPATQELGGDHVSASPAPLTAPLGDAVDFTSAFKANKEAMLKNVAAKAKPPVAEERVDKLVEKLEEKPTTPTEKADAKLAETKTDAKDPNYGKAKVRYSELPPEKREYLLASEERRVAKLEETERRAKEAEDRATAHEARIRELEVIAETAPKERDEYKGKYESEAETRARIEKELMAANVLRSPEYARVVTQPFKTEVQDALVNFAKGFTNFDVALADQALRSGDAATLKAIRKSLPDEDDRADFRVIENRALGLLAKHNEYVAKGADADKEIKERRTTEEKQAIETHRSEVQKSLTAVREANAKRFPFLDPKAKDLPPEFKAQLEAADAKASAFDFNALKPAEQARIIEDAHKAPLAVNFIDGYVAHLTTEKQKVETERDELKSKVADLENRLKAKEGVTMTPGRTGSQPNGVSPAPKPESALAAFNQAKRSLLGRR